MGKRYRLPIPKVGTIDVRWGRTDPFSSHSLCYTYGNRDGKSDSRIVMRALEDPLASSELSLAEELEARGYDLTTLRFSISKKSEPK